MVLHAFDLYLMRHGMISIILPVQHQGPWRATLIVFLHYNISLGYIYLRHAGHKMKRQLYGSCRLFITYKKDHCVQFVT
jgi:hypothetical protein